MIVLTLTLESNGQFYVQDKIETLTYPIKNIQGDAKSVFLAAAWMNLHYPNEEYPNKQPREVLVVATQKDKFFSLRG